MSTIETDSFDVLTFDCYGTLIDWEAGLLAALAPVFAAHGVRCTPDETLARHAELESAIESGPYVPYRAVLGRVLEGMGEHWGFHPSASELDAFASSVGDWPVFPDVPAALQTLGSRCALGIVSNVDDDLFARTRPRLGARIDWVVTAQQVSAYKPSERMFLAAFERAGASRSRIVHVAQSRFHDIVPAKALGLRTVWIDRRHGRAGSGATPSADAEPDLTFGDLAEAAAALAGR